MRIKKRRFADLQRSLMPKAKPQAGRCNYPLDQGTRFCRSSAGKNTAHPGSGYCKQHEAMKAYDPVHRYRNIKQPSIRKQLEGLVEQERQVFDLVPEIMLMRGLLIDYIERFYEFREALFAWYQDSKQKPRGPVDIIEAGHLIEGISRLIERHHRIERSGSIDLATFHSAMERVGIIVAKHVRDGKVLDAIEADWRAIELDSKTPGSMPAPKPTVALPAHEEE